MMSRRRLVVLLGAVFSSYLIGYIIFGDNQCKTHVSLSTTHVGPSVWNAKEPERGHIDLNQINLSESQEEFLEISTGYGFSRCKNDVSPELFELLEILFPEKENLLAQGLTRQFFIYDKLPDPFGTNQYEATLNIVED